nr:MGMT family protein [Methanohalophilus profundi]
MVIPCHRVVAKNSIGGYAGGTELKKKLLEMEKSHLLR